MNLEVKSVIRNMRDQISKKLQEGLLEMQDCLNGSGSSPCRDRPGSNMYMSSADQAVFHLQFQFCIE